MLFIKNIEQKNNEKLNTFLKDKILINLSHHQKLKRVLIKLQNC